MPSFKRTFFAYPARPPDLKATIESAATAASNARARLQVDVWPALDILGEDISDSVRDKINSSSFLVADITVPNTNVFYEIGYAIGKGLPLLPVLNNSFDGATKRAQEDGLFDNIKYHSYQNSSDLAAALESFSGVSLIDRYSKEINYDQPLFLLDAFAKTDFRNSVVSGIKSSKVFYRSFDPEEVARFSTARIIGEATSSLGVIIPLLAPHIADAQRHNLRASFLAGIAHGISRPTLLIQNGDSPVPADYRDAVKAVRSAAEAQELIANFANEALRSVQHIRRAAPTNRQRVSPIRDLWLGASAAENEFRTLENYFLQTAEFIQTLKGTAKVVVGRKGSGKTAIFFMVRDNLRTQKSNIVVDLKPESHELVKLRELLEQYTTAGVLDHTFAGFWFALILIEIALTLKREHSVRMRSNKGALEAVLDIERTLQVFGIDEDGDFTSRLRAFVQNVIQDIQREIKINRGGKIPSDRLTNFVFGNEQKALRELIARRAIKDGTIAVLFDNLDKGWPVTGVKPDDVSFIRALIEALNRVQRELPDYCNFQFSVFLRNDIYELLVARTTDRGKEAATRIDWSDREKLRLVIAKRIAASVGSEQGGSWVDHFPQTVEERDGLDFAIDHSLMRPRFLIDIVERSISFAINREHSKVTAADLIDAVRQHSNYLVDDFGYEIRDASELPNEIIDAFLGADSTVPAARARELLAAVLSGKDEVDRAIYLLVWYGFFGVEQSTDSVKYIYDFDYSMRRMEAEIARAGDTLRYYINPAFYVGLS